MWQIFQYLWENLGFQMAIFPCCQIDSLDIGIAIITISQKSKDPFLASI